MTEKDKNEIIEKLRFEVRVIKGKLQFYVRHRSEVPEGEKYADNQINFYLNKLRKVESILRNFENK